MTYCSFSGIVSMTILAECSTSSCLTAASAAFLAMSSATRAASKRSCCSLIEQYQAQCASNIVCEQNKVKRSEFFPHLSS